MKIPQQYRVPLGISLVIHLGLLIFLMVELPSTNTYRMSRENSPVKIVNAVAVSQNKIDAEVKKLKEA